jgi:amino acid adenylation domain-containing protein
MWFLNQFQPNNPAYNLSLTIPLPGRVDDSDVRRTLNEIIRRHEVLRTNFIVSDGRPVQSINSHLDINLSVLDLRTLPEQARQVESMTRSQQEIQRPFDLSTGPLIRALMLHLTDTEHLLLVSMHHIVSDGWSLGVFMDEFNTFYQSFSQGGPVPLPELPLQYADFAIWQRELLSGDRAALLLEYWRRQLEGAPELLNLPIDYPPPAKRSFEGAAQYRSFKSSAVAGWRDLAQSESATLFMVMLAGFKALLHRYTGQDDIVVGSPVANRSRKELEPLIGFFVNTLVLRSSIPRRCTFLELLRRVRDITIDAQAHQDLPFEHLVAELLSSRDPSRNPLFQVMFALQNSAGVAGTEKLKSGSSLDRLGEQPLPPVSTFVKFDLTLTIVDHNSEMLALWEYRTDLFSHATITRMAQHFETLLQGAINQPDMALLDLQMLSEAEQHLQLTSWSSSESVNPEARCLHELIEEQVVKTPDDIALVCNQREFTFGELNRRANNLAHHLRALGVRAEQRVGVCMARSAEMVMGILAVLKAGGAYVPLDPSYPKEQLAFILKDSSMGVVLTLENLLPFMNEVAVDHPASMLCLDRWLEAQPLTHPIELNRPAEPDNIAYVIYTSGSTGRPKGALISHRAIVNHMRWMLSTWPLRNTDRILQRTPTNFDASVWEIFAPLMSGARLVLSTNEASNHNSLPSEISHHGITVLQVVPSLLRVLLKESGLAQCDSLRRVYCGGEALNSQLANDFYEQQDAELFNLYGPTETAIDICWWKCPKGHSRPTIPIGRPISNAQIYILDSSMRPIPLGASGELHVGGEALARGYLGRPALTAEAFVPSPFGNLPGARLYRTGDLARYLPDGSLEFVGRRDHQVKVRGFRIELTAVEAALLDHPEVEATAVVDQDDGFGDRRLVAYATSTGEVPPPATELRSFVGQRLPGHMIPSAFVFLKELPLLPNGKINRAALAQLGIGGSLLQEEFVSPQNEVETKLAEIWRSVLRLDRVGVRDNFFALGGHSLLASQVAARVRDAFAIDFSLSQLFESQTISALAEVVQNLLAKHPSDATHPEVSSEARRRTLINNIEHFSEQEIDAFLLEFQK